MQELPVAIEECPDEAGAAQEQRRPAQRKAQQRLRQADRFGGSGIDQSDLPCLHRQCLAAMAPEPDEICRQYPDEVDLQQPWVRRPIGGHPEDDVGKQNQDRADADQQQALIEDAGKAARDAWRSAVRGVSGHGYCRGGFVAADVADPAGNTGSG